MACAIASFTVNPFSSTNCFEKSIISVEFLELIPISPMKPIKEVAVR